MNNIDDLLEAVDTIADITFDARIAQRPSGSTRKGYYRPGERSADGINFSMEVQPRCSPTKERTGRAPTDVEKRGAWPLQDEYLAGRLGKNEEENSRLWYTAKWIDLQYRVATMPAEAAKALNLYSGNWKEDIDPEDITGSEEKPASFGVELLGVSARDLERIKVRADAQTLVGLIAELNELDRVGKVDADKLLRGAGPRHTRVDLPCPDERAESGKIVRMLLVGMRTLWTPVKLAIHDHMEMYRLGISQGVRREPAAAVGRQRVIEGLRIADSIRKGIARGDLRNTHPTTGPLESLDELIRDILVLLPKPLAANDNFGTDDLAVKVA